MPPPPPPKRQKRPPTELPESVYSGAVSHIIQRDYFPGLVESEAQSEYLAALDSKDPRWIRDAGRNLTTVMTPGPGGDDKAGDFESEESPYVDVNMSLDAFQAKYTSEDNESFNELLDKQNEKRAAKYDFFDNDNKILAPRQIAHRERSRKLLENGEQSPAAALITTNATGEARRLLALGRVGQDLDARPASVDSFPNRQGPRNPFMFVPAGVEEQPRTSHASVNYAATRFRDPVEEDAPAPSSPSMSAVDAAIAGRPKAMASEAAYGGVEAPTVGGYAFVDAEPGMIDQESDAAERQAASRFLPKVDDAGPNPFQVPERSRREELHHRLVDENDGKRRTSDRVETLRSLGVLSGTPGRTVTAATPKFPSAPGLSRRAGGMTPAAQALASRLRTPRRDNGVFDTKPGMGRAGRTPTPKLVKKREGQ